MKTHGWRRKELPECSLTYAAVFLFLLGLSSLIFMLRNTDALKSCTVSAERFPDQGRTRELANSYYRNAIWRSQTRFLSGPTSMVPEDSPPPPPPHHQDSSPWSCPGQNLSPEDALEERSLIESIRWPEPPHSAKAAHFKQTSDPAHSHFTILPAEGAGGEWHVGDRLEALVQMRDFQGQPKRYGGDFLLARLHEPSLGAGVAGRVVDHLNGSYSAVFPLLWEGRTQVEVTLVHPSEAVSVLRRLTKEQPARYFFNSGFRSGSVSENTVCNVCLPPSQNRTICNYTNLQTGEPWYCYKPNRLSCEDRMDHSGMGGFKDGRLHGFKENITTDEKTLFQPGINMKVSVKKNATGSDSVLVLPKEKDKLEVSKAAMGTSGYYYQGGWRALGGRVAVERFHNASAISQCLRDKQVFIYGDSTARMWFEYLTSSLPDLNEFDLHSPEWVHGMALDIGRNILVKYRCHAPPLWFRNVPASQLRYVAEELEGLDGGPKTVVLLSVWAHFSTLPVEVYVRRLLGIRRAVVRLLRRAPQTTVVVRTANLKDLSSLGEGLTISDWYSARRDAVLRAIFGGLLLANKVVLVDAWEMTLAHSLPHLLHPQPPIVQNMMDVVLSNVCPRQRVNG